MRAFKTEGVILRRRNFGEADRILTVFSLSKGKITVIAKGVRRITSRRSGNVELLNRVAMFLYPGKQFLILTEAESLNTYQRLKEDLTLSSYAYHIIELIDKLTAENQENRILYGHLIEVLNRLSIKPRQILIRAFEAKILSNLGFADFKEDLIKKIEGSHWNEIEKMAINEKEGLALERILLYHIERVIEGRMKSRKFLRKI